MDINITKTKHPQVIPDKIDSFGKIFTDHMFIMDYERSRGWYDARIVPFGELSYKPSLSILHYGQGIFEGLKAYKNQDDVIRLFRPEENFKRFNRSAKRMSMPEIDVDFMLEALKTLILLDKDWIPTNPDTSLYIRPYMIANESTLGVRSADKYQLLIILSPSGTYYKNGLAPVEIMVEENYVRAVRGGLGEAKTMANYAASLLAAQHAAEKGYDQVLWLDGVSRQYIEEVGSMNIMFKIDGKVITPALNGSILPGITRDSVIQLLKHHDIPVEETTIAIQDIIEAAENNKLEEIFGTGTAAVISPVSALIYKNKKYAAQNQYDSSSLSSSIYHEITGIQTGELDDPFGWVRVLN